MPSWLDLYVEYASNNEVPEIFHWWTGATILGAALRRNVSFSQEYYRVWPSMYVLLVAASGAKKTTGLGIGYGILSKLDHIRLLADRLSPEALARSLAAEEEDGTKKQAQGLLYAPELANFLDKKRHNEGMVQLLLRLYDSPDRWIYETISGGRIALHNVALTFLGATANELLYECMPAIALKTGFLARFICVYSEGGSAGVPFPWKENKLELQVVNSLYELSLIKGEMRLPVKVRDWYINWYFSHKQRTVNETSLKLKAYHERKPDHLLKLAMIVSIADNRTLEYTVGSFEKALMKLEEVELQLPRLYDEIESSDAGRWQTLILDQLTRLGAVEHKELIKRNRVVMGDSATIKKILITLVEAGLVVVGRTPNGEVMYRRRK